MYQVQNLPPQHTAQIERTLQTLLEDFNSTFRSNDSDAQRRLLEDINKRLDKEASLPNGSSTLQYRDNILSGSIKLKDNVQFPIVIDSTNGSVFFGNRFSRATSKALGGGMRIPSENIKEWTQILAEDANRLPPNFAPVGFDEKGARIYSTIQNTSKPSPEGFRVVTVDDKGRPEIRSVTEVRKVAIARGGITYTLIDTKGEEYKVTQETIDGMSNKRQSSSGIEMPGSSQANGIMPGRKRGPDKP